MASPGTTAGSANRHPETRLTGFSLTSNRIDDVFGRLVEQAAARGLLHSTYSIDATHVEAIRYNDAASWNYNPTAEEYYYGFDCTIVSTGAKIPIAAEFTQAKQASQETAMRVTRDALAVDTPIWMLGDSAYDILDWHDHLLAGGVVPVTPYNPRNTDDPKDIEYRVEARIENIAKTYNSTNSSWRRHTTVAPEENEQTMQSGTAASGTFAPEPASTHEQKSSNPVRGVGR